MYSPSSLITLTRSAMQNLYTRANSCLRAPQRLWFLRKLGLKTWLQWFLGRTVTLLNKKPCLNHHTSKTGQKGSSNRSTTERRKQAKASFVFMATSTLNHWSSMHSCSAVWRTAMRWNLSNSTSTWTSSCFWKTSCHCTFWDRRKTLSRPLS